MHDRSLTRMVAALARRDAGSVGRIATLAGVDRSTVSHWLSEDGDRRYHVPLDALPAIVDALDSVDILRLVAEEAGHEVVPRARPTASPVPLETGIWSLLEHASKVGVEIQRAASDARIDDEAAPRIRAALSALRDCCESMLARLPRQAP